MDYRLYFHGRDGHIHHVIMLDCEDDDRAIRNVCEHRNGEPMELWQRGRKVRDFPARL